MDALDKKIIGLKEDLQNTDKNRKIILKVEKRLNKLINHELNTLDKKNLPVLLDGKDIVEHVKGIKSCIKFYEDEIKELKNEGCFASPTPVLTPYGWSRIDKISKNQEVITFDQREKRFITARVKSTQHHNDIRICELQLENVLIETTLNHPFLSNRGWVQAKNIKNGDELVNFSSGSSIVQSSDVTNRFEVTHNLIVEEHYNYIVAGYVANSFCHLWNLRMTLNKAFDKTRHYFDEPILNFK